MKVNSYSLLSVSLFRNVIKHCPNYPPVDMSYSETGHKA